MAADYLTGLAAAWCTKTLSSRVGIVGILKKIGYEETDREYADFVLFNTCTVRENVVAGIIRAQLFLDSRLSTA